SYASIGETLMLPARRARHLSYLLLATGMSLLILSRAVAQGEQSPERGKLLESAPVDKSAPKNPLNPAAELRRLRPDCDAWIDAKDKQVIMQGEVCLTQGPLEMFAVTKGTKEHEAVVSVNTKAQVIHAALLAVGAKSGQTVKFMPNYQPASGDK